VCQVIANANLQLPINDATGNPSNPTPGVTNSTLGSAVAGTLVDVDVVGLNGTHTWINDLSFNLISPAATNVQVMAQSCADENNFNLSLDDEAAGAPGGWPCPPVGGGTYVPSNPLSGFDGQAASGTWTLRITDSGRQDTGTLQDWGLNLCVIPPVVNQPPNANAQSVSTDEDTVLPIRTATRSPSPSPAPQAMAC
jgi:subtilisin-like proprotein convertase family protein